MRALWRKWNSCRPCAFGRGLLGVVLQLAGSLLFSYAVLAQAAKAEQATAPFEDRCAGCPAGASLDSVRVQDREGSTLFAVSGRLPATIAELPADVRLEANDVSVTLRPSPEGFRIVSATRAGLPLAPDTIAAGLAEGRLLLDIRDGALAAPVTFAVGFVEGDTFRGRLPGTGRLVWEGTGAPRLAAAPTVAPAPTVAVSTAPTPARTAAPTPAASTLPAAIDVMVLADGCTTWTGSPPAFLELSRVGGGSGPDPRSGMPSLTAVATFAGTVPDEGARPAFSVAALIERAGETPGRGARPIDTLGSLQLWAYWDGRALHKGVRTWTGSAWTNRTDAAAEPLTAALSRNGLVFYSAGLRSGDRIAFVVAGAGGCRALGLDAQGRPGERIP